MATQYLFPCSCGKSNLVETSQAGQTISCVGCGEEIELPSLLKIKQLEIVESAEKKQEPASKRSYGQAVLFTTGLALLLTGGIAASILFYLSNTFYKARPEIPANAKEKFKESLDNQTLAQNFDFWENRIKKEGPGEWTPHEYLTGEILSGQFGMFAYIASAVGGLGLIMMIGSVFMRPKTSRRRARTG